MRRKKVVFGMYGAGGFAREVMHFAAEFVTSVYRPRIKTECGIYFIERNPEAKQINEYKLISETEFLDIECEERTFNIAISDSKIRRRISDYCVTQKLKPLSIRSPHSILYECNEIGEGAILCANTTITANVTIGKYFHLNIYSYVAHDCIIGDYVTFAPNVHCNGNVHIHDHAYIGTGAIIRNGSLSKPLIIGEGATVGMGAVVTRDVPPYSTVIGNPARIFEKAADQSQP